MTPSVRAPQSGPSPTAEACRLGDVLEPRLFESFRFYVRQIASSALTISEAWGRRISHNDPYAVLIHRQLEELVSRAVGRRVKASYAFVASYQDGAEVPRHRDREQCRYTLDLCLEDRGGDADWPLWIEGTPWVLRENEAILYRGTEQIHWRDRKPDGKVANLVFFHFVDEDFAGDLL